MSRPVIIASLLGASIGVPYLTARHSGGEKAPGGAPAPSAAPFAQSNTNFVTPIASQTPAASAPLPGSAVLGSAAPADGPRFQSVDQFLRFDVTKEWVYRTWDRKSTGPTDVGLFGVRVPLVMGTQPTALAGSLTYYFNSSGQVEHISFRGRTADTSQLVNLVTRTYEFKPAAGPTGEQVYQVTRRGRVQSELRAWPEWVLDRRAPHRSIAVELELARPGSRRFLPPRGPKLAVPPVASPPPVASATSQAGGSSAAGSGVSSYLNGVRYASPQEEGQVLWKRWPN
jgi:hypothetical protein